MEKSDVELPTPLIAALPGAVSVLVIIPGLDQHTVHWPGLPSIYLPWYLIINLLQTVRAETVKVCLVAALSLDRQEVSKGVSSRTSRGPGPDCRRETKLLRSMERTT